MTKDLIKLDEIHKWTGGSIEWIVMEFIVYSVYMLTMVILLIKSRWIKIGVDQTKQFEPTYMSMMANAIISAMKFELEVNMMDLDMIDYEKLKKKYCEES